MQVRYQNSIGHAQFNWLERSFEMDTLNSLGREESTTMA